MVLPALMGALRGLSLLGRGVMVGSRFLIRGMGSAARWAVKGIRGFVSNALKGAKKLGPKVAKGLSTAVRKIVSGTRSTVKKLASRKSPRKALPKGAQQKAVREFERFFAEHPQRVTAIQNYTLRKVAEHVQQDVKSRLPAQYKELSDALTVEMLPGKNPVYVVRVAAKSRKLKTRESKESILYVRPKKRTLRRVSKAIKVLEEFGPWTSDTLPFMPGPKEAIIVRQDASKKTVKKVRDDLASKESVWRARLTEAGKAVGAKLKPKEIKVITDVHHQSVSLEFGLGVRSVPHWRPAVSWVHRSGPSEILSHEAVSRAMFDPKFTEWKKWKPASKIASPRAVKNLMAFQKKMGIGS